MFLTSLKQRVWGGVGCGSTFFNAMHFSFLLMLREGSHSRHAKCLSIASCLEMPKMLYRTSTTPGLFKNPLNLWQRKSRNYSGKLRWYSRRLLKVQSYIGLWKLFLGISVQKSQIMVIQMFCFICCVVMGLALTIVKIWHM